MHSRHEVDQLLPKKPLQRLKSKETSVGEKLAANGVAGTMKAKIKIGLCSNQISETKKKIIGGVLIFHDMIKQVKKSVDSSEDLNKSSKIAFRTIRKLKEK